MRLPAGPEGAGAAELGAGELGAGASAREPWPVRAFCVAILGGALAAGVVLLAGGAARPAIGPVLLLAVAVALCVNRFALFPSEQAATAEAAVLLAAVVAFRAEAAFLGPLAVALLVGPLDTLHWEQRSFLRMAHNAGNRGLAVLAASLGFVVATDAAGTSPAALALAVAVATLAFAAVDIVLSVGLLLLQGQGPRGALRHVLDIDALTVPVALYGALAGFLAGELGWWATALALLPAAFVPEVALARARWRVTVVRDVMLASALLAVVVGGARITPVPDTATLGALVGLAILAGLELGVDARATVPPMLAVVVVAAVVVADGDRAFFAASLVAVTGTLIACWQSRVSSRPRLLVALATAGVGGLLAAAVSEVAPSAPGAAALVVIAAGLGFQVVGLAIGASRRGVVVGLAWAAPLLVAAVAWASVWDLVGLGGGVVFGVALAASAAAAVGWGTPPWRSRVLGRWVSGRAPRSHRVVLLAVAAAAVAGAAVAGALADADARSAGGWVAVGLGEAALAMGSLGVRQWRFAPGPRRRSMTALLLIAAALAVVVPGLARDGSAWAPIVVAASMVVVVVIARVPAGLAHRAAPGRREARRP